MRILVRKQLRDLAKELKSLNYYGAENPDGSLFLVRKRNGKFEVITNDDLQTLSDVELSDDRREYLINHLPKKIFA